MVMAVDDWTPGALWNYYISKTVFEHQEDKQQEHTLLINENQTVD